MSLAVTALDGTAILAALVFVGVGPVRALVPAAIGMVLLRPVGLSRGRLTLRVSDDATSVVARSSVALILGSAFVPGLTADRLVIAAAIAWSLILMARGVTYAALVAARRRDIAVNDVIIVGAGLVGTEVARTLASRKEFGLRPVGFVDRLDDHLELPVLGPVETLPELLEQHQIRHVIVAFGHAREAELVSIVRGCATLPVELYTLPRFFELGHVADARSTEDLWGFPLVRLRSNGSMRRAWQIKRAFDVLMASALLAVFAPVMAACAVAVKLSSPGPVLFKQQRVVQFGRTMEMLKFRTMTVNDDSDVTWSVENDQRVTSVGRFLRPTHLDELPQLWNVMRGEMSIVGPRPERPVFVEQFASQIAGYDDRHRYPVGLTGWAQVNGLWGDTSIEDRARLDNGYIERWSLWTDIVIVCKTLPTLFGRRGA